MLTVARYVTVSRVESPREQEVALMVVVPVPTKVATPRVPAVLLIVATAGLEDD